MDDNSYVALSEKVTATFYDDEHEEWTQETMTIADVLDSVCDDYTVIPSAQPEIKTGRWKEHIFDGIMGGRPRALICTQCNTISLCAYDFCPNCGAKMLKTEN